MIAVGMLLGSALTAGLAFWIHQGMRRDERWWQENEFRRNSRWPVLGKDPGATDAEAVDAGSLNRRILGRGWADVALVLGVVAVFLALAVFGDDTVGCKVTVRSNPTDTTDTTDG